ncbi:glyoxalase/bleomycin resistance/extradiol dioxygenase family protein [Galbibacter sp. EGI 63066]|uniref:VOC family protein n=1 Tax=Galbibacter sp. EGI 63066 TaxID=2993559 RepID=UPI002248FD8F|nr:glyoxalase/bleomycin resistance/extradiol dioxygenase family protein [Galbibacter sp. EGI 63066]MCX2678701.1 glyoxalase/bleomycin resistance/extradiol dioxygenase family protein [Galbibacter sp. EGI 63066]
MQENNDRKNMGQLIIYLTFNGNCKEAMEFYQECLGGELHFQTLGESPKTEKLPEGMKVYIVQASLKKDDLILMGTDMVDKEVLRGNSVSILLDCNDEDGIKTYYKNLKAGGNTTHPLQETPWGELFGGLTDKYGHHWLFHCKKSSAQSFNKI